MCCERNKCCSWWRMIQSVLGILAGLSAGFVFYHKYGNAQAAGWALTSAIFASACLHLAILLHKGNVVHWYTTSHLFKIQIMAVFLTVISTAAFAWYIFYTVYYNIPMMPVDKSAIVTSVWVFMTAKWTGLLWLFARIGVKANEGYESIGESQS